jgi:hypothetical protein
VDKPVENLSTLSGFEIPRQAPFIVKFSVFMMRWRLSGCSGRIRPGDSPGFFDIEKW